MDDVESLGPGPGDDKDVDVADRLDVLAAVAAPHLCQEPSLGPHGEIAAAWSGSHAPVGRTAASARRCALDHRG